MSRFLDHMSKVPGHFSSVTGVRMQKYVYLSMLLMVFGLATFISFANYATRTEIDKQIHAVDTNESIETLMYSYFLRERAIYDLAELNCQQRELLALYRWQSMPLRRELGRLFTFTAEVRDEMAKILKTHDHVKTAFVEEALDKAWGVPRVDQVFLIQGLSDQQKKEFGDYFIRTLDGVIDRHFRDKTDLISDDILKLLHSKGGSKSADSMRAADISAIVKNIEDADGKLFNLTGIDVLQNKIKILRDNLGQPTTKDAIALATMIRKHFAEAPFATLSGPDPRQILNFVSDPRYESAAQGAIYCESVDRTQIDRHLPTITQSIDKSDVPEATKKSVYTALTEVAAATTRASAVSSGTSWWKSATDRYFLMPTAVQALVVTMLAGLLGALTANMLMLSHVGYWRPFPDPDWGDLFAAPLLGMVAAFVIYLLAAVVSGFAAGGGVQMSAAGAAFVALVGFVSGLLNLEAFARVRQFGEGLFAGAADQDRSGLSQADTDLIKALEHLECRWFADIVRRHHLGEVVAGQKAVTLLAPVDGYFQALTAKEWSELTSIGGRPSAHALLARLVVAGKVDRGKLKVGDKLNLVLADPGKATVDIASTGNDLSLGGAVLSSDPSSMNGLFDLVKVSQPPRA